MKEIKVNVLEDEVRKVFVYGSLKEGFHNHRVIEDSNGRFVGKWATPFLYTMVGLHSFPAVIKDGVTSIKGEVYEVDHLSFLDRLEGYPSFYNRHLLDSPYGPVWMYTLNDPHRDISHYPKIHDGEWTQEHVAG